MFDLAVGSILTLRDLHMPRASKSTSQIWQHVLKAQCSVCIFCSTPLVRELKIRAYLLILQALSNFYHVSVSTVLFVQSCFSPSFLFKAYNGPTASVLHFLNRSEQAKHVLPAVCVCGLLRCAASLKRCDSKSKRQLFCDSHDCL